MNTYREMQVFLVVAHAGSLAAAAPVESFTAVLLGLNRRYRTRAALTVTGIPGAGMAEVLEKEGGPAGASGRCA